MNIGIIRKHRRLSVETQREELLKWGADPKKIWTFGQGNENLTLFLNARVAREGDNIGIYRLALLIDPGRGTHEKMKRDVRALMETGATLHELDTGRTWDCRGDLVDMVSDAIEQITTSRVGRGKAGRPRKHKYTSDQWKVIDAVWASKDYTNDAQREAAVRDISGLEGFNRSVMHRRIRAKREQSE